jgi:hypothetical protein
MHLQVLLPGIHQVAQAVAAAAEHGLQLWLRPAPSGSTAAQQQQQQQQQILLQHPSPGLNQLLSVLVVYLTFPWAEQDKPAVQQRAAGPGKRGCLVLLSPDRDTVIYSYRLAALLLYLTMLWTEQRASM